jgi:23S rRNA (uracil1939-C5)-methyltransferase
LGICASTIASQVLGIELSLESSLDARENAKANGCHNVTILPGDVGKVLEENIRQNRYPLPDVVMVDPPRVGLDAVAIRHLLALKAAKILYVSCNPATQAMNIQTLCESGYHLKLLQPVDQFPQTPHVENIAILERE